MRAAVLGAAVTTLLVLGFPEPGVPQGQPVALMGTAGCPGARQGLVYYRRRANELRRARGVRPYPVFGIERTAGCPTVRWKAEQWRHRAILELSRYRRFERAMRDPIAAIRYVFGPYADQAIRVSYCETGGTFSVWAENGQYRGIFQMGTWERATYGHGDTPLEQARAAYRYFVASGKDWSPWECKPW